MKREKTTKKLIHVSFLQRPSSGPRELRVTYLPMHQQSSILNFNPRLRLTLQSRVTSKVLVSVTISMGDFIHNSNAIARLVSLGLISCFIVYMVSTAKLRIVAEYSKFWGQTIQLCDDFHFKTFPLSTVYHIGIHSNDAETY